MTDNTQPEALVLADEVDEVARTYPDMAEVSAELRRQHARIAELEAQLEAIGAGGVSGPLMGQPQEMPDLSALTERGAKAWAGVDTQGLRDGFTAADMATASAQGFRDGVASLAASAGREPVAHLAAERDELFQAAIDFIRHLTGMEPPPIEVAPPEVFAPFHAFVNTVQAITNKRQNPPRDGVARPCHVFNVRKAGPRTEWTPTTMALALPDGEHALYTHPSPPEGMVGGWISVEDVRKPPPGKTVVLWVWAERYQEDDDGRQIAQDASGLHLGEWREAEHGNYFDNYTSPFADREAVLWWMDPAPPTSSADSRKGE